MIRIYLFFILLMASGISQANVRIELIFSDGQVKQGSLQEATLQIDMASAQSFEIQKLKEVTAGDSIYFHKLSPLLRSGTGGSLSSDVTVVFLKAPESNHLQFKIGEQDINLTWNDIQILPTEVTQQFIFENFSIPARKDILFWIILGLALIVSGVIGFVLYKKFETSHAEKKRKLKLKEEILSIQTYDGVIQVWQNKTLYLKEFPHIEFALKNLEKILFKYAFKPAQSEQEKAEILKAYRSFVNEIQEGFNGI